MSEGKEGCISVRGVLVVLMKGSVRFENNSENVIIKDILCLRGKW